MRETALKSLPCIVYRGEYPIWLLVFVCVYCLTFKNLIKMKCLINFAQKIDFQSESLNGVKSCLFVKACKYIKTTDSGSIDEGEDGTYIGTDFLNSGINNTLNKVLFFDSTEIEKQYLEQFSKLFDLETGEKITSKNIYINLERIDVTMNCDFYQRFSSDGNNHVKGEFIKDSSGNKRIFNSIPVIVVCDSADNPKENASLLAKRNWDANVATREDFSKIFVPVELYEILRKEKEEKDAALKRAQVSAF